MELKKHLAKLVRKNIKKIRKTLPKKSEELEEVESFLKLVKADKAGTVLENFSAVKAAMLVQILKALNLMEKMETDAAKYYEPYSDAVRKAPRWKLSEEAHPEVEDSKEPAKKTISPHSHEQI